MHEGLGKRFSRAFCDDSSGKFAKIGGLDNGYFNFVQYEDEMCEEVIENYQTKEINECQFSADFGKFFSFLRERPTASGFSFSHYRNQNCNGKAEFMVSSRAYNDLQKGRLESSVLSSIGRDSSRFIDFSFLHFASNFFGEKCTNKQKLAGVCSLEFSYNIILKQKVEAKTVINLHEFSYNFSVPANVNTCIEVDSKDQTFTRFGIKSMFFFPFHHVSNNVASSSSLSSLSASSPSPLYETLSISISSSNATTSNSNTDNSRKLSPGYIVLIAIGSIGVVTVFCLALADFEALVSLAFSSENSEADDALSYQ
eukprot:Awhi_evm2s5321